MLILLYTFKRKEYNIHKKESVQKILIRKYPFPKDSITHINTLSFLCKSSPCLQAFFERPSKEDKLKLSIYF